MSIKIKYDQEADAAYIRLSDEPVDASEEVRSNIVLDFDVQGRIVGIEVLHASRHLSSGILQAEVCR
jgi:uncharacterized protein YuzE